MKEKVTKDNFENITNKDKKTNSNIICGSIDQDETLKNETFYIDNEDLSLLSSTVIPENAVEERTKINLSGNSLKHTKQLQVITIATIIVLTTNK